MKLSYNLLLVFILSFSSISMAKTVDMNSLLASATSEEKNNLPNLLSQITLVPTKEKQAGKTLLKVKKVETGSFWEKQGVKLGI